MQKKSLSDSIANSQVSLLFSKIIGSFQFTNILSPRKLDENAGILHCERMETIIHFRKNMMAQPSFYY